MKTWWMRGGGNQAQGRKERWTIGKFKLLLLREINTIHKFSCLRNTIYVHVTCTVVTKLLRTFVVTNITNNAKFCHWQNGYLAYYQQTSHKCSQSPYLVFISILLISSCWQTRHIRIKKKNTVDSLWHIYH